MEGIQSSDDALSCNADAWLHSPNIEDKGPSNPHIIWDSAFIGFNFSAGGCPKYASEIPGIENSNNGIDFETECFLSYLEWDLDNPGHAVGRSI